MTVSHFGQKPLLNAVNVNSTFCVSGWEASEGSFSWWLPLVASGVYCTMGGGGGICWVMCRTFVRAYLLGPGRSKTGHLHCIWDVWRRSGGTVHYRRQRAGAFSEACFGLYSTAIGHRCDIDVTGQRAEQIRALRETLWAHGSGGTRCQSGCFNTRTWSQDTLTSKPKTYLVFTVMLEPHSPRYKI